MGFWKNRAEKKLLFFEKYLDYIIKDNPNATAITKLSDPIPGTKKEMYLGDILFVLNCLLESSKNQGGWDDEPEIRKIRQKVKAKIELDYEDWKLLSDIIKELELQD